MDTSNTEYALRMKYGKSEYIPLKDICQELLGVSARTAEFKAKAQNLPFPVMKVRPSERSPSLVHIKDLAKCLDVRYALAEAEHQSVQAD
ncbi:MAG: hypothetical protein ACJAS1_006072 [Oleiphilaceae bacterium]|jgi:hypothetical protein